jgi:hypothetical protein
MAANKRLRTETKEEKPESVSDDGKNASGYLALATLREGKYSDYTIKLIGGDIPTHKAILAKYSEEFKDDSCELKYNYAAIHPVIIWIYGLPYLTKYIKASHNIEALLFCTKYQIGLASQITTELIDMCKSSSFAELTSDILRSYDGTDIIKPIYQEAINTAVHVHKRIHNPITCHIKRFPPIIGKCCQHSDEKTTMRLMETKLCGTVPETCCTHRTTAPLWINEVHNFNLTWYKTITNCQSAAILLTITLLATKIG